jgi:four helix bundle protein
MRNDKENVIVQKSVKFAISVVKYCEVLEQDRKYVIAKQLLRSVLR